MADENKEDPLRKKIKVSKPKPKIKASPKKKDPKIRVIKRDAKKAKPEETEPVELSPEEAAFEADVEILRRKMARRGFETDVRLKPTAAQLKRGKKK